MMQNPKLWMQFTVAFVCRREGVWPHVFNVFNPLHVPGGGPPASGFSPLLEIGTCVAIFPGNVLISAGKEFCSFKSWVLEGAEMWCALVF